VPARRHPLVAFTGRDDGGNFDIFTVNVDTGEVKRLTQGEGRTRAHLGAERQADRVLLERGGIWLMTKDGLNQNRVHKGGSQTPAWSK